MRTRQAGAAHINIFYLLILLIVFAGSVFFGYTMLTKRTDLENRLASREEVVAGKRLRDKLVTHYGEDLRQVTGLMGTYEGREQVPPQQYGLAHEENEDPDNPLNEPLRKVTLPGDFEQALTDGLERLGISGGADGIDDAIQKVRARFDALESSASTATQAMKAALAAAEQAETQLAQVNSDHSDEIAGLTQELDDQVRSYQTKLGARNNSLNARLQDLRRKERELHEEKVARAEQVATLESERERLRDHKEALDAVLGQRNEPTAPDGEVVAADIEVGRGFIDLGRVDNLTTGITFRITDPRRDRVKAYGTVIEVGEETSEIEITGLVDEQDPVAAGDRISNDRFTPNVRRTIYLMGRFERPWDKQTISRILDTIGHDVVGDFDKGVDLVILGDQVDDDLRESAEYQDALDLGVEFAPVSKIRDLLKLGSN